MINNYLIKKEAEWKKRNNIRLSPSPLDETKPFSPSQELPLKNFLWNSDLELNSN